MKAIIKAWDQFWFGPLPLLNMAVFRIILCTTLFLMDISRQFDLERFYSEDGILPRASALMVMPEFLRPSFAWFFWSNSQTTLFHSFLVIGLALLVLGIGGRILTAIVWVLYMGFLHRNFAIAFGADVVGAVLLFLMIGARSCDRLSVWNLIKKPKNLIPENGDWVHSACYRLIQIQICVIYIYTGWEKLKGGSWWHGTALWTVLANPQMVVADFTWTRYFPWLLVFLTYSTVLFEIYFPVLIWVKKLRPVLLTIGVLFHLGIGFVMALMNFACVMMSPYVLFLDSATIEKALIRIKIRQGKIRL